MGIYINDTICGIQLYTFNDDGISNVLYEVKQETELSDHQMRDAYLFYNNLTDKDNVFVKIYIECSSTLGCNIETFMTWHSCSFTKLFGVIYLNNKYNPAIKN